MTRKIYIISLAAVTLTVSALLFTLTFRISSANTAREKLDAEIAAIKKNTDGVRLGNEELEKKISDIDTELSSKNTVNNYYMEYKKTHDDLTAEVDELKKQSAELDSAIEKKRSELKGVSELSEGKNGRSYTLEKNKTYSCPGDIPEGRYTASGSGTFTVLSASGKVRLSQNLDVAFDGSYTFNLAEKERIRVTGDAVLTEIK